MNALFHTHTLRNRRYRKQNGLYLLHTRVCTGLGNVSSITNQTTAEVDLFTQNAIFWWRVCY